MSAYFDIIGSLAQAKKFEQYLGRQVDQVFEKAENVLDLWPSPLRKVSILLCDDDEEVSNVHESRYGTPIDAPAFISLGRMEIVISIEDTTLKVFAHEVGHAILEQYFQPRPPYKLHELMAQYCEKHIED